MLGEWENSKGREVSARVKLMLALVCPCSSRLCIRIPSSDLGSTSEVLRRLPMVGKPLPNPLPARQQGAEWLSQRHPHTDSAWPKKTHCCLRLELAATLRTKMAQTRNYYPWSRWLQAYQSPLVSEGHCHSPGASNWKGWGWGWLLVYKLLESWLIHGKLSVKHYRVQVRKVRNKECGGR